MSFVKEEENFILFKSIQNFGQNTGNFNRQFKPNVRSTGRANFSHNFNQTPINSFNTQWPQNDHLSRPFSNFTQHNNFSRPIFPNFNQPNYSRTSYSNFNHANFSRPPFNNFNNHTYQPKPNFPFNNHSDNSRRIPFTPKPPFGQRSYRSNTSQSPVEPMDTSFGNTVIHNPKKNFISQELYNREVLPQSPEELTSNNNYSIYDLYKNIHVDSNLSRDPNYYKDYKNEERSSNFPSTSRNMDTT
ncbi:ras guanine nucleotide exchange factor E-like [Euwallacea similis]|uniref:ras guanine nucleotide exchange factor E-like n=1 Tax=Euwallacea similis TaxID=1736056 RepID=UPI00344D774D